MSALDRLAAAAPLRLRARSAALSWWCRHGQHRWRLVAVSGSRQVGRDRVGAVTQSCRDCPATRHEQHVVLAGAGS